MNDFLTAAAALWVYCLILVGFSAFVLWAEHRERRIARARARENELTLAYIADVERVRQVAATETAKARLAESPANQRTPAPWFTGGDVA